MTEPGTELVERAPLLDRLAAALADGRAGRGRLVVVRGEAGAGKTALVRAALAGTTARWGWCEPLDRPRPLGPFRDLVDVGEDDAWTVGERLLAELTAAPTVLVVEDAHWVDDAAADLLRYLGRRIEPTHGVVVVTVRDDETGSDHPLRRALGDVAPGPALVRLDVPALTREGVATLLDGTDRDAEEAWRVTGGNAFLVDQLRTSAGPTGAVRDAAVARLTRLSPGARRLVRDLAVVPGRLPVGVVGATAELDEAVGSGLLETSQDTVGFRHELVRLAVEADLGPAERAAGHQAALARTPDADPAVLAFHARGAGLLERAHVLTLAAAAEAAAAGAHREAVAHLRQALEDPVAIADADRARLGIELTPLERTIGQEQRAHETALAAVAAADRAGDPLLTARALSLAGRTAATDAEAEELVRRSLGLLAPHGETAELAEAQAALATVHMIARDLGPAAEVGREAVALAERIGATEALVIALQALGCTLLLTGQDPEGAVVRRAVAVASEAGLAKEVARGWSNLVSAAGEQRLYATAHEAVPDALAFSRARDLDAWADYTCAWQARCLFEEGRWSEASHWVDEVLPNADGMTRVSALTTRGRIRARRGDPHVWEALDEAKRLADTYATLQRSGPVAAGRAEARWLRGEPDDGSDGLAAAYELARHRDSPWLLGELSLWMARHGLPLGPDPDEVIERVAEPYRLQLTGDHHAAGEAWLAVGCPYEAADAWCDGDDEADLRRALETAHQLGAGPLGQRAARRLRELGVRSVPRGPRESTAEHPAGLTAREQDVLGWLREGHTDAEIAAGLHLSVKTVGHHVSAVLRKTGATGRRQLLGRDPGR